MWIILNTGGFSLLRTLTLLKSPEVAQFSDNSKSHSETPQQLETLPAFTWRAFWKLILYLVRNVSLCMRTIFPATENYCKMLAALEWNNRPYEIILWFDTSLLAKGVSTIPPPPTLCHCKQQLVQVEKITARCTVWSLGGGSLLVVVRVGVWGMSEGETSFVKYLQSVGILVIQQASVEF